MNEKNKTLDMNTVLLNLEPKSINLPVLKKNIEDLEVTLYYLDPEKDKDKYLCLSCIFGAFLGDSIGSCCEFSSASTDNHTYIFKYENGIFGPGEVTDDSEMAMSAAFAYIDILNENPSKIQDLLYYYYGLWRCSGPKDIGRTTTSALRFWNESLDITNTKFNNKLVKVTNWDSLANGYLMRISTFITYYYYTHKQKIYFTIQNFFNQNDKIEDLDDSIIELYIDILKESYKNVEITHPNYENGISSAVFTLMTLVGMVTKDAKKVYSIFEIISKSAKFIESHPTFKDYALLTQSKYKDIVSQIDNPNFSVYSSMGYYIHGFRLSVFFIHKYPDMSENKDPDLYYKIMCDICDYGGDTDTNCAIVGAMIGPLIGYKNFKDELFERFIKFIPDRRCQYNSAFMYVYVNYLEEKLNKGKIEIDDKKNEEKEKMNETPKKSIKKEENNTKDINKENKQKKIEAEKEENEVKKENKQEKIEIEIEENKLKDVKEENDKNKKIEENKEENKNKDEELYKKENKEISNHEKNENEIKKENKQENDTKEIKEEKQMKKEEEKVKDESLKKEENKKSDEKNDCENKSQKSELLKKEDFKYTAYNLILKFLNEEMDL